MTGTIPAQRRGTIVTAMFTDIVNSTQLKGLMPAATAAGRDEVYRAKVKERHDARLLELVTAGAGREVQSTGDGYLFTFDDAERAILSALDIQDSLRRDPIQTPMGPLQVRIGIHTGIANAGPQITGAVLDKAARVQANGQPGEVFISQETHVLVAQLRGVLFEVMPPVELKGLGTHVLVRAARAPSEPPAADSHSEQVTRLYSMANPYEFAAIADGRTFKGRRHEMEELLAAIESGTHTAVFGLQRMGKTSLIEQGLKSELQRRPSLRNALLIARVDLQRLGGAQVTYKDFVHSILEAVIEQLNATGVGREVSNLRNITREILTPSRYQRGDRTEFFATFARVLSTLAAASHRRIVLFIDEFSEIRKVVERNKMALHKNPTRTGNLLPHDMYIDVPFMHHMSSLLRDAELKSKITFIVLVRPFIAEYDEREGLQLFKLMQPITLRHLDETAARELITEPLASYITVDDDAVSNLITLTAGHPYLLQFMLKLIVDRVKREARPTITNTDVRWLENRMISDGPAFDAQFAVLISDYSIDEISLRSEARLGKGLLAQVSKLGQHDDGWARATDIYDALARNNVPEEKTASLLSQLTRTCILMEENQDDELRYRLSIPLVQERFIKQNLYLKYFRKN